MSPTANDRGVAGEVMKVGKSEARFHGSHQRSGDQQPFGKFTQSGKFGRMFPELRPLVPSDDALLELASTMKEANPLSPKGDNSNVPAGFTYLGQFIDHDITFDPSAIQEALVDPLALRNFRTPALDLDCLYGGGPAVQPYLYDPASKPAEERFLLGVTQRSTAPKAIGDDQIKPGMPNDLPRAPHGFRVEGTVDENNERIVSQYHFALIGDPRNDENLIVAQLHVAMLKFHNKVLDGLLSGSIPRESPVGKTPFEETRDLVIWHYQHVVLNDFLARILDEEQMKAALVSRQFYTFDPEPFIPVEFSGAAYRLGHSMVREAYDYNRVFGAGRPQVATLPLLFTFTGLSGQVVPVPSDWIIDWRRFFDVSPNRKPGLSRKLDPLIVPALHQLPKGGGSLPKRNLLRGARQGLPSGQSVARFMKLPILDPAEIADGSEDGQAAKKHGFNRESPLWYYVLKEAQVRGNGERLGPVGSRIVAEVFVGLLDGDSSSFRVRRPGWRPTLRTKSAQPVDSMARIMEFIDDINPIGD